MCKIARFSGCCAGELMGEKRSFGATAKLAFGMVVLLLQLLAPACRAATSLGSEIELQTGDLYALVVGVAKYRDPKIPRLELADRDAKCFGEFLQTQKKIFKNIKVTALTNEKATKSEVEKYLYYTLPKAGKNDTIILFFSGHGATDPVRPKEFLFLTHDSEPDYLATTSVRMTGLDFLKGIEAERILIIADACHAGGFTQMKPKTTGSPMRLFMQESRSSSGLAIITSGTKDQLSWEVPNMKNSVFTFNFIEGLKGKADKNHDGVITLSEAYEYAYNKTKEDTHGRQHPQFEGTIVGPFPLSYVAPTLSPAQLKRQMLNSAKSSDVGKMQQLLSMGADVNTRDERNNTVLLVASHSGNSDAVKLLLAKGADIDALNSGLHSALSAACQMGHVEVAKVLLAAGSGLSNKDSDGFSPLAFAARGGNRELVSLLLSKGASLRCRTNAGKTPLMLAASDGRLEVVRYLLEKKSELGAKDLDSNTALTEAARRGHAETTRLLLDQGADLCMKDGGDLEKRLMLAALRGDAARVEELLYRGAAIDAATESGDTALTMAAGLGHMKLLGLLVKKGANPNLLLPCDETPLTIAAKNGRTEVVKALLDGGAAANVRDQDGNTALIAAAEQPNPEVVGMLLAAKADPNAANKKGRTALTMAAENGRQETVRLLLNARANDKAADSQGNNALLLSARRGHTGIVKMLCERSMDVNLRNAKGLTALMVAAGSGNKSVVKTLLSKGANPKAEDWEGNTALSLASEAGNEEVIDALKQHETASANP